MIHKHVYTINQSTLILNFLKSKLILKKGKVYQILSNLKVIYLWKSIEVAKHSENPRDIVAMDVASE